MNYEPEEAFEEETEPAIEARKIYLPVQIALVHAGGWIRSAIDVPKQGGHKATPVFPQKAFENKMQLLSQV